MQAIEKIEEPASAASAFSVIDAERQQGKDGIDLNHADIAQRDKYNEVQQQPGNG